MPSLDEKVQDILFADATSPLEGADFSILGVPLDVSCCHRRGTRFAPRTIREESYNFETFDMELGVDLEDVAIYDAGNAGPCSDPGPIPEEEGDLEDHQIGIIQEMVRGIEDKMMELTRANTRPVLLGGDHSITPHAIEVLNDMEPTAVVLLDAHLDYRSSYLGTPLSHACTTRRISELVGISNVVPMGTRSCSKSEFHEAKERGLSFFGMPRIRESSPGALIDEALQGIDAHLRDRLYLSIDIDVIDPAYAPGVGTPEPFGMRPDELMDIATLLAPRLIGFDIVEVCPPYDNGNTSALAAKLTRSIMALMIRSQR